MTRTWSTGRSILLHLVLWIFATLLVVAAAVSILAERSIGAPFEQHLARKADELATELARSLAEAVWNMDDVAIRNHLESYPWDTLGLEAVDITTEFDDTIFKRVHESHGHPIERNAAIQYKGHLVGYAKVAVSRRQLTDLQRRIRSVAMVQGMAASVVLLVVCAIGIRLTVVRPAYATIRGLKKIGAGDYTHRLTAARSRELNAINSEINLMAEEIQKRRKELEDENRERVRAEQETQQLNATLEQRIRERTARLQRLAMMLNTAQNTEQQRIAEGLHDDVAQLIAAAQMRLNSAAEQPLAPSAAKALDAARTYIEEANRKVRLLSFELASSAFYKESLKGSLKNLCAGMAQRYSMDIRLHPQSEDPELNETYTVLLFKSARELLFNAIKHADATTITVRLQDQNERVMLRVEDDGCGITVEDTARGAGLGLFSIRERLLDIGGEMVIDSSGHGSTRITLIVPRKRGQEQNA